MIRHRTVLALALWIGSTGYAVAGQPSQAQIAAVKQWCPKDYRAHCSSVPTGGSAALACLREHAAELSPNCLHAVNAMASPAAPASVPAPPAASALSPRQKAAMLRRDCGPDYRAFCRGVRPGGGAAIACLRDNAASLSPHCQDVLMSLRASR